MVLDEFTPECLTVQAARSFTARDVILTLHYIFAVRGAPQHIRSDNGKLCKPKFVKHRLSQASVRTFHINKVSPRENGYVESFNGKLRDELRNRELFLGLDEARYVLDEWRLNYNHHRPHSGIKMTDTSFVCSQSVRTSRWRAPKQLDRKSNKSLQM